LRIFIHHIYALSYSAFSFSINLVLYFRLWQINVS